MATCHLCGETGAEDRREVYTGSSKYYGSHSSSTRLTYSVRSVCRVCAVELDNIEWRKELRKIRVDIAAQVLLAAGLLYYIIVR